ncbi:aminotransferase class III-fold pyridoxal phosphate-dependent enzyme [Actinomycetota bacterium]
MTTTALLAPLRALGGARLTDGLPDATIDEWAERDPSLRAAVEAAVELFGQVRDEVADVLDLDEADQVAALQEGFVNFYAAESVNPYVALAARGPWIVTLKGAVVYDTGGYGMLGFGHAPAEVIEAMATPQVMANIMTPAVAQRRFLRAIQAELGHTRGGSPFSHLMCLNSGSEAVGLAARIADINANVMTAQTGARPGAVVKRVVVKGAFHGRTDRPALLSDSSRATYDRHLASYRGEESVITVEPYDEVALKQVFADADANNWFIEMMAMEPVMGEGNPGRALPPEFYATARELTRAHGSLLLVDSIQAGLRAHGTLSVVDYPGFEDQDAPDMETYSKALNAGQFPLSVLALGQHAAGVYVRGTYGNTMTANPRGLDVATAVLAMVTPELRANIRDRGAELVAKLGALAAEQPEVVTNVQGTGLLVSCELARDHVVYGKDSTEQWLRQHGLGVIHGGENSLRFTPHFRMTSAEVDLVVGLVRDAIAAGAGRRG